ncbi:hypothetical protein [Lutibacter sp.]|uniref:hypothetical protein n=1 Tax=Lutibacter sp. TaxID=1925666 RepID=UPI002736B400|nr:hypothetical protein [Lutibacter sp.]MDP3314063.1 hypothetical protein [Lutibacter sp.]
MKTKFILFVLIIGLTSCDISSDCGDCFTPPREFNFVFVDEDSSQDLFENGTFNVNDLAVTNLKNETTNFKIIKYQNQTVLSLNSIGWVLEPSVYTIKLSPDVSVIINVDMDKISGDCCTYFEVKEFKILNYEYSESTSTGIIKIEI